MMATRGTRTVLPLVGALLFSALAVVGCGSDPTAPKHAGISCLLVDMKLPGVEVMLVSRENFFAFTPMLHEVAASDLDVTHIVNPIRKLLKRSNFFQGEVEAIDLQRRTVTVRHGAETPHSHDLPFDHLVLAGGATVTYFGTPGAADHGFPLYTLADAVAVQDLMLGVPCRRVQHLRKHLAFEFVEIAVVGLSVIVHGADEPVSWLQIFYIAINVSVIIAPLKRALKLRHAEKLAEYTAYKAAKGGLKVAGHVQTPDGATRAIEAGLWSIEHGMALSEEHHKLMAKKGIFLASTVVGGGCYWLKVRAEETGRRYWWNRYYACRGE